MSVGNAWHTVSLQYMLMDLWGLERLVICQRSHVARKKQSHPCVYHSLKGPAQTHIIQETALCWLCKCSFKIVFSAFPFQFPIVFPCPVAGCSYVEILNSLKPRSADKQFLNLLFLIQKWLMKVRWKCQAAGSQISLSASPTVHIALIACLTLSSL